MSGSSARIPQPQSPNHNHHPPRSQPPSPRSQPPSRGRPRGRLLIGALTAAFLLRLCPIGRYVTPDEPAWVYRAIRFHDAVAARDWAAVPSTGHPGATTMWLGAIGVAAQRLAHPGGSASHLDWIRHLAWLAPDNGAALEHLNFFLTGGRVAVAVVTTLGLLVLYLLFVRLFDRRTALLAAGLLAFDPFLIGHSGLLHTDGLLATFSLLALATALLGGLQEPRRVIWPTLSGCFTGLALLTKSPAVILLPFILGLLTLCHVRQRERKKPGFSEKTGFLFPKWFLACALFVLTTGITVFALYPALWADLAGTLRALSAFSQTHVGVAQRPIFFAGQMTYNPGPAYYPAVFLFRVSPVVLIGLVIGLATLQRMPSKRRFALIVLIAFALGFGALMSLGTKKHDRYLLPSLPPLGVAAAVGWEHVSKIGRSRPGKRNQAMLIPLIQLALTLPFLPHPLTAFNLLAGGPWVAARVLPTDWGEGLGAAARWLNQLPAADQLTVAALSVPSFAPLFDGETVPTDRASLADYLVLAPTRPDLTGFPEPVRSSASGAVRSSASGGGKLTPPLPTTHTVRLGFLDHAVVYTNTAPAEQSAYLAGRAGSDDLILLEAETPLLRRYTGPSRIESLDHLPDQAAVDAHLRDLATGRLKLWLVGDPSASPITAEHVRRGLKAIATPVYSDSVGSATITQYVMRDDLLHDDLVRESRRASFGDRIVLVDTVVPTSLVDDHLPVVLRWQASAPMDTDLHASLTLRDPAGHLWAEVGQPVLNDVYFPTSAWTQGEWADNALQLKRPKRIPPDSYAVQATVTDGQRAQLGAWDAQGQFQGVRFTLAEVEIGPPADPVGPAPCTDGHTLAAGPLAACVPDLPHQEVPSGDALTLALTWSAAAAPETDTRVRWRLLAPGGALELEHTADLCPYATSQWRAGDSFEARYDLRIDPALRPGHYRLMLNVLSSDGSALWPADEEVSTVEITPRERLFELPPAISYPLDLTLGTTVHLRGFDLASPHGGEGAGEEPLQPGDTLSLTLYWQLDGPTDIAYTTFVHLLGPDGRPHGQVDQFPGGVPTTSAAPGQVIVDQMTLPVDADAPAGAYHIAVGMYDAVSGGRLPITDSAGQPLPDSQAVLPIHLTISGTPQ